MTHNTASAMSRFVSRSVLATFLAFTVAAEAQIILSSGHVDVFEAEYEQVGSETPTVHLGVHSEVSGHFEPADVLLQVNNAAYTDTSALPVEISSILGPNAWILPADGEQAESLGVLYAGVAQSGFPGGSVTFSLVSSGASNPGNFVLYSITNAIRLSSTGGTVGANSFGIIAGHIHYNWGFSAPGTYTFDMQASYEDPTYGPLQSPVETYTFQVVPEPSTFAMLAFVASALMLVRLRRCSRQD